MIFQVTFFYEGSLNLIKNSLFNLFDFWEFCIYGFGFPLKYQLRRFQYFIFLKSTYQVINVRRFINKVLDKNQERMVESFGAQSGSGSVLEGAEIKVLIQ